jgi:dUTP pyrophosphatase
VILYFKKLHPLATLPIRGTSNSVGVDIHAMLLTEDNRPNTAIIPPRNTRSIPTGLAVMVPSRDAKTIHFIQVCSRSGMALKSIFVANAPGIVDPDYTGEIRVLLYNGGVEAHYVKHGDRIAQLILTTTPIYEIRYMETELPQTERGARGFGSTGR